MVIISKTLDLRGKNALAPTLLSLELALGHDRRLIDVWFKPRLKSENSKSKTAYEKQ